MKSFFCNAIAIAVCMTSVIPGKAFAASQKGWSEKDGGWVYLNSDGSLLTDDWKQSGSNWFYLNEKGNLATNSLIETNDNYYYVNHGGARVVNEWRMITDEDGETSWYYFGSDGKAKKAPTSGKVTTVTINGQKYAFDSEGRMLYGWVKADSAELLDDDNEDAWIDADYYFGEENDGAATIGWRNIGVVDDDDYCEYWFYFGENGKKTRAYKKTIDGYVYNFDTTDGHMLTGWATATSSEAMQITPEDKNIKYLKNDGSAAKNSWVWAVPDEDYIKSDYDDDEYSWWFTNASGKVYTDTIRTINNKRFAFDEYGRMLTNFVTADNDKHNVQKYADADEVSEADLFADKLERIYYCSSSEEDGAIKTGYQNIEIEDGIRNFWFNSSGIGSTGYITKISKFTASGMILCADDEKGAYAGIPAIKNSTYELSDSFTGLYYGTAIPTDGSCILVNKNGVIQKNKKNAKADDLYYCTDSNGFATYVGEEKYQ